MSDGEKEKDMKKKTKLLLAVLSATAVTCGAFGIAACSGDTASGKYYDMYQAYVAEAEADGQEALDYDAWLDSVLNAAKGEKGDQGVAGKDGATWLSGNGAPAATDGENGDFYLDKTTFTVYNKAAGTWVSVGVIKGASGANGTNGVGIADITYEDGTITITYTDASEPTVITVFTEEQLHKHTYSDDIYVLIQPTETTEGLGYKKCDGTIGGSACEHIELLILPKLTSFELTFTYNGEPLESTEVTLTGEGIFDGGTATLTTDESGKITVGPLAVGNYTISIPGYEILGGSTYNVYYGSQDLTLGLPLNAESDDWGGYTYSISAAGTYIVPITIYAGDPAYGEVKTVTFNAGDANTAFKITCEDPFSTIADSNGNTLENNTVNIRANSTKDVQFSVNDSAITLGGYTAGDTVYYIVKVESVEAAAEGEVADFALDGSALTSGGITKTVDAEKWVYYSWTNPDTNKRGLRFTVGEGNTVVFNTHQNYQDFTVTMTEGTHDVIVTDNTYDYGAFSFHVKSSTGAISVSAEQYAPAGDMANPAELTTALGTETSGVGASYYYKWTAPSTTTYAIDVKGTTTIGVFSDEYFSTQLANIQSGTGIFAAEEGVTYYIQVGNSDFMATSHAFTLRAFNAATDTGLGAAAPMELTTDTDSIVFDQFTGERYYVFTNNGTETVNFQLIDPSPDSYELFFEFYTGATFGYETLVGYDATYVATLAQGESIYIKLYTYGTYSNTVGITITPVEDNGENVGGGETVEGGAGDEETSEIVPGDGAKLN